MIVKDVNEKFLIGEDGIEIVSEQLKFLVDKYKFSLESIKFNIISY